MKAKKLYKMAKAAYYEVRLGSIYEEANNDMVFDFLRGVMKCYGQLVQQSEGIEDDDFNSDLGPV